MWRDRDAASLAVIHSIASKYGQITSIKALSCLIIKGVRLISLARIHNFCPKLGEENVAFCFYVDFSFLSFIFSTVLLSSEGVLFPLG